MHVILLFNFRTRMSMVPAPDVSNPEFLKRILARNAHCKEIEAQIGVVTVVEKETWALSYQVTDFLVGEPKKGPSGYRLLVQISTWHSPRPSIVPIVQTLGISIPVNRRLQGYYDIESVRVLSRSLSLSLSRMCARLQRTTRKTGCDMACFPITSTLKNVRYCSGNVIPRSAIVWRRTRSYANV